MTAATLIWVTAADGSVHAARPPILAAGHQTLCGLSFGRRDLRVRIQAAPGAAPAHACGVCRDAAAEIFATTAAAHGQERRGPLWP